MRGGPIWARAVATLAFGIGILPLAAGPRSGDDAPAPARRIGAAAAVRLAEWFIRANGYTDLAPPDRTRLAPESFENRGRASWLAGRRGTLRPRAVGYLPGGKSTPEGWTVGFEYAARPPGGQLGRAVTMDAAGEALVVQHQDLRLWILLPRPADPGARAGPG